MKRELYDGKEYEYRGRMFEIMWMDHVGNQPCEYAVMCVDVPGKEMDGVCMGFVPCGADDDNVYSVIDKNFGLIDSKHSRVSLKEDGVFVTPMSNADRLYWVVGIMIHPSLASMSDDELQDLEEHTKLFERVNFACYENMDDAISYAKAAGTPTKRIIGVVCNSKNSTGGYGQGGYVWLKNAQPSYAKKGKKPLKGIFPLFKGKRK